MGDNQPARGEQGVDLGPLAAELSNLEYPVEKEKLLQSYGSRKLDLVDGETTLRDILERDDRDTYEDEEGIRQSIVGLVGDEAVGRKDYTDRGGTTKVQDPDDEPESI